jgi:tRNA pseudouridine65 synthase
MELLYRDDRVAAFNKPSGLLVHRGWGDADVVAVDLARRALGVICHPIHRLDRATSGVLLFALDAAACTFVQKAMESGEAQKTYVALVRGIPPEEGTIDHPIPRREDGPRVPALTTYRRVHTFERYAVVEAMPKTGRLHQVRRHMKHISHPLIGDVNYGKGEHNRLFRERFNLHRLALHARRLVVPHPDGGLLTLDATIPDDLGVPLTMIGYPPSA